MGEIKLCEWQVVNKNRREERKAQENILYVALWEGVKPFRGSAEKQLFRNYHISHNYLTFLIWAWNGLITQMENCILRKKQSKC